MNVFFKLIVSVVVFFLLGELLSYAYFFHKNSQASFGWEKVADKVAYLIKRKQLKFQLKENDVGDDEIWQKFYHGENNYISTVKSKFTNHFKMFLEVADEFDTEVIVLYIPQTNPDSIYNCSEKTSQIFFKELAKKNQKTFIDLSEKLDEYKYEYTTLYPNDFHLSRFGNYIVANNISDVLASGFLSTKPNISILNSSRSNLGHFGYAKSRSIDVYGTPSVRINDIGIRSLYEIELPKRKHRVACIGDSFTFGHRVLDDQTYPHILSNMNQNIEVLNFGVPGTTIISHLDIFKNLYELGLDVVIIQFGDNDLIELMAHRQEIFSRVKPSERSKEETEFLRKIGKI